MHTIRLVLVSLWTGLVAGPAIAGLHFYDVDHFSVPTDATMMLYSASAGALIVKSSTNAIAVVDIASRTSTLRLANSRFTDVALSPSGRYAFAADYGGENIGYGTPFAPSYVHRVDLDTNTWATQSAYIAGNIQAVSDTQVILKSLDQWVTFTNNAWGPGDALIPLNTAGCCWGPGYFALVYGGNFRYDVRTGRLIHGNYGLSSQEVQAFTLVNNDFVRQEGSGVYGTAQGYGGSIVLATDGSALYYGALQVDPSNVARNTLIFPEIIFGATGHVAVGSKDYYDAHSGALLGSLGFQTSVYAMNADGDDFWAYDPATSTVHHYVNNNVALASNGGVASASSAYSPQFPATAINDGERAGVNWGNGGGWNDNTAASYPDWAQLNFNGNKTIDRVVVYTVQDNYSNPVEPNDEQTFSLYGVTDFTVQAWSGSKWVTLASVNGNNLVKRTVTFSPYHTARIRINVTRALASYSRITEVEAWDTGPPMGSTSLTSASNPSVYGNPLLTATVVGATPTGTVTITDGGTPMIGCTTVSLVGTGDSVTAQCFPSQLSVGTHTLVALYSGDPNNAPSTSAPLLQVVEVIGTSYNVGLSGNGSVASASSTYSSKYPVAAINDGERAGANWGNGGGWNDSTPDSYPDWVQLNFAISRTIDRVVVYTVQDNYASPVEPTDTMTFSLYGITAFKVQGKQGGKWVTLATVTGNNLIKRPVVFAPFTTDQVRINVSGALASYSRITEVEVWGH